MCKNAMFFYVITERPFYVTFLPKLKEISRIKWIMMHIILRWWIKQLKTTRSIYTFVLQSSFQFWTCINFMNIFYLPDNVCHTWKHSSTSNWVPRVPSSPWDPDKCWSAWHIIICLATGTAVIALKRISWMKVFQSIQGSFCACTQPMRDDITW